MAFSITFNHLNLKNFKKLPKINPKKVQKIKKFLNKLFKRNLYLALKMSYH